MKQIYVIPNIITAFALACGLFVIFKVNMIEPGSGSFEIVRKSALLLLLAAFADFIDGAVARAFKANSDFGIVFDSMADAVSFGVAPSVILLKTLALQQGTILSFLSAAGAMMYSLCGVLRLVRYTVRSVNNKQNVVNISMQKKHFTGLPIPASAAAAISANLFLLSPFLSNYFFISNMLRASMLTIINVFLGYLMVSKWKFPSLKGLHFRLQSFYLAFLSVILAVFVLYGIFYYFSLIFLIISWGYVLIALIIAIIRFFAKGKIKTFKDFDPEEEDEDE